MSKIGIYVDSHEIKRYQYGFRKDYKAKQAGKNGPTIAPLWRKATKTPFFDTYSPIICDAEPFQERCLAKTMCLIALYNYVNNWASP